MKSRDFNSINWQNIFAEDSNSPTGLIWKVDRYRGTNSSTCFIKAGEIAGYIHVCKERNLKYAKVKFKNKSYAIHRILWIMRNGSLEDDLVIDHIDGDGLNNSISNLRKVQNTVNLRNQRVYRNNSTGNTGVSFTKTGKRTYVTAQWHNQLGNCKKHFSVLKLGLLPAYAKAVLYREQMIRELNDQGFKYSSRHGTELNIS